MDSGAETIVAGATASLTISAVEKHTVGFYAIYNAGNSKAQQVIPVNIDLTAPQTTTIMPAQYGVYPIGTALNFNATDALSG